MRYFFRGLPFSRTFFTAAFHATEPECGDGIASFDRVLAFFGEAAGGVWVGLIGAEGPFTAR
jgi:hypothetical protein